MAKKGTLTYTCPIKPPPPGDIPITPPYVPIVPVCQPVCQWAIDFAICPWIGYGAEGYEAWDLAWSTYDTFTGACVGTPYQAAVDPSYPMGRTPGLYRGACIATRYGPVHCPDCPGDPDVDETPPLLVPAKEYYWSRANYDWSESCCDLAAVLLHSGGQHTLRPSALRCVWDAWWDHVGMKIAWNYETGYWTMWFGDMITTSQFICHYQHLDKTGLHPEGVYAFTYCWKVDADCTCPDSTLDILLEIHES